MRIALPQLNGGQTTLRPLKAQDVPVYIAAFQDDHELGRLLGIESDPTEGSLQERIRAETLQIKERTVVELAIADPTTDALLGEVIVHHLTERHRRGEVGFWVVPAHRGQSVASHAVGATLAWLFGELDLLRVEMATTPDNQVVPLLAGRLGFTQEGLLRARNVERGQRVDLLWFGLLREEWQAAEALSMSD